MLEDVYYIINNNYYYNHPQQNQDFMVIETGTDERAPIILGRPFLNTLGVVIYVSTAKISFYIKGKKKTFFLQEQNYTNSRAIPT